MLSSESSASSTPVSQPALPTHNRAFAEDVWRGLTAQPRRLSPMYLYDDLGSCLFDSICRLPWYRVTRAEKGLLERYAGAMTEALRGPLRLIELGPGNGEKIEYLVRALSRGGRPFGVDLVDISPAALEQAKQRFQDLRELDIELHACTYEEGLTRATEADVPGERRVVLLLGSNIGNFSPIEADAFLAGIRARLRPGDALLLGVDLVKNERELVTAYDDPLGVTAAFNKNLLTRLNRELGADFDLGGWQHRAVWKELHGRIEMHLVSRHRQTVRLEAVESELAFEEGEFIWTESSYKFHPDAFADRVARKGFRLRDRWIDREAGFMNILFTVPPVSIV